MPNATPASNGEQNLVVYGCKVYLVTRKSVVRDDGTTDSTPDAILLGKDDNFTLPVLTARTTTANIMGEMTVPIVGQYEDTEATWHHKGSIEDVAPILAPGSYELEVFWGAQWANSGNVQILRGGYAYLSVSPKVLLPQLEINTGEALEFDIPLSVPSFEIGGRDSQKQTTPIIKFDRLNHILQVNGQTVSDDLNIYLDH